ncbi:MAG TPA: carboxylating nicotinate-nucleotide diphosphorylase [Phycisphaerae bacterium]|nr:carboxylating nicotinate-nucleotide diphosphorylase [Phycisphaerae bacterium]
MLSEPDIDRDQFRRLVELARDEDLGPHGDVTSRLLPPLALDATGNWHLTARQAGRFAGVHLVPLLLESLAPRISVEWHGPKCPRGDVESGEKIALFSGLVCQMLAAERTLLNFLQHLSGVATLTARYVAAVAGTHAKIYDTRKTTPGMRTLEKYAVRCGGGHNHRTGLYDAVLLKDNHLATIPTDRLAHAVFEMLNRLETLPSQPAFVEVECDGLDQFAELLKVVGIDVILLDNFEVAALRQAVSLRDRAGLRGKLELEASGGITLETVREIAETGVERIAVGAITHSAPILDLGLDAA